MVVMMVMMVVVVIVMMMVVVIIVVMMMVCDTNKPVPAVFHFRRYMKRYLCGEDIGGTRTRLWRVLEEVFNINFFSRSNPRHILPSCSLQKY